MRRRLRGDSPYLVVGDDESGGIEDDNNNLTTELGVLDGDSGSESGAAHRHRSGVPPPAPIPSCHQPTIFPTLSADISPRLI